MCISDLKESLLQAVGENSYLAFEVFVDECEDKLLGLDIFPDAYFALFLEVLSDRALVAKKGSDRIVSYFADDFFKLSEGQKEMLLAVILNSYSCSLYEDFRLRACDLVAREYDHRVAYGFFLKLSVAMDLHGDVGVLVGLDILFKYAEFSSLRRVEVTSLYKSIEGK